MRPGPEQVRDIAVAVRIKTIGGACQDLGKRPRGGIKISSKCTRPPLGGLAHETTFRRAIDRYKFEVRAPFYGGDTA